MSSSSTSTNSISSVQVGGADYEEDVVAPCCFSQENIGSEGFFLPDSPNIFQHFSIPEFKDVHDPPQHYCQDQGHEEVQGAHVKESKGKQPLQEGQSCPPDKYTHDFAGKRRASERKRRKRINTKLKTLQELIPHSDKKDQASILDEAINYIQSLKLQVDMMRPRMQVGPMTGCGPGQFQMGPSGYPLTVGPAARGGGFGFQVQPFPMQPQVAVTPAALFCPPPQFFPAPPAATTFPRPPFFPPPNQPSGSPNQEAPRFQPPSSQ